MNKPKRKIFYFQIIFCLFVVCGENKVFALEKPDINLRGGSKTKSRTLPDNFLPRETTAKKPRETTSSQQKGNNPPTGGKLNQNETFDKKGETKTPSGRSVSNANLQTPTSEGFTHSEQKGNSFSPRGTLKQDETLSEEKNTIRLFMRTDKKAEITDNLPYPPPKSVAQHLNYPEHFNPFGEINWKDSGYLSLFEYKQTEYKEHSAIKAIDELSNLYVHYIFLPYEEKEVELVDKFSDSDETSVHKWHETETNKWKEDVRRTPSINIPSKLLNTENIGPAARVTEEDLKEVMKADRYIKEHLFVGRFPKGTLIYTEENNNDSLLSRLKDKLPKGDYIKPNMPNVSEIMSDVEKHLMISVGYPELKAIQDWLKNDGPGVISNKNDLKDIRKIAAENRLEPIQKWLENKPYEEKIRSSVRRLQSDWLKEHGYKDPEFYGKTSENLRKWIEEKNLDFETIVNSPKVVYTPGKRA